MTEFRGIANFSQKGLDNAAWRATLEVKSKRWSKDANRRKNMTNKDKDAVALALMRAAGNLLESYQDGSGRFDGIAHLDQEEVRQCLASWLKRLPGTGWDMRLGKPN